jgi:hypothetical protein
MAHGADAADARCDMVQLAVRATTHKRLKETRGLDNLKATLLDISVLSVYDDVTMSLDSCHVMNVNI